MRGLKLPADADQIKSDVASFTDAWIETKHQEKHQNIHGSHLLQMRGLKPLADVNLLLWYFVASFTDAWIETHRHHNRLLRQKVASFTDAWIETRQTEQHVQAYMVASFTDAWIET